MASSASASLLVEIMSALLLLSMIMIMGTSITVTAFSILGSIPNSRHNTIMTHPHPSLLFESKQGAEVDKQEKVEQEECLLLPETNPNSDPNATSLSGVRYSSIERGIDALYPPHELSSRNAKSRTDGYWKYVERGEKPPREFTYGEFDIEFFGMLLDRAWGHYLDELHEEDDDDTDDDDDATTNSNAMNENERIHSESIPWRNRTFCDIGSGTGRLVLTAAALHPEWKLCRGLEILEGLYNMSTSIANGCNLGDNERQRLGIVDDDDLRRILRIPSVNNESNTTTTTTESKDDESHSNNDADYDGYSYLPLAPINFTCGSFTDPYEYLGDIDCAFVFSSCMKPELVRELSIAIGRQCKPGTIIITTEFPLFLRGNVDMSEEKEDCDDESSVSCGGTYEIQLLEKVDGWCWLMGGESTAYVHRVKTSLWEEYGGMPRERSLEEDAYRLVKLMEDGELTDTEAFLRRVRNDMVFHGVPEEFFPEMDHERR